MVVKCFNCKRDILTEADTFIYQHRPHEEYYSCGCKEITQLEKEIKNLKYTVKLLQAMIESKLE